MDRTELFGEMRCYRGKCVGRRKYATRLSENRQTLQIVHNGRPDKVEEATTVDAHLHDERRTTSTLILGMVEGN